MRQFVAPSRPGPSPRSGGTPCRHSPTAIPSARSGPPARRWVRSPRAEAGGAGRPVLGTCFGGTPEVVLEGETGRIVNPFQTAAIAEALEALLADPAERARLGERAATRIRTEFPLCKMVQSYAELFESLV